VTGGPEALHQLVDALRAQGVDAALTPISGTTRAPRAAEYKQYDAPERSHRFDDTETALVFPEVYRGGFLARQPAWCWWLSVDNSILWRGTRRWRGGRSQSLPWKAVALSRRLREIPTRRLLRRKIDAIEHLAQSTYAWSFVLEHHHPMPSVVSDYVTMPVENRTPRLSERPVIAFNPAKGGEHVRRVRDRLSPGSVEWVALEGMSREEVRAALLRTHVYLDLGFHPGKDRLPREAAACGATVALLRTGSAAFSADVPIPGDHKIDPTHNIPDHATTVVTRLLSDLERHHSLQARYREMIRNERSRFEREVRAVFVEGLRGFDDIDAEGGNGRPCDQDA
jgi:hypothetical protein